MSAGKIIMVIGLMLTLAGCSGGGDFVGVWQAHQKSTTTKSNIGGSDITIAGRTLKLELLSDKTFIFGDEYGGNWTALEENKIKVDFVFDGTHFPEIGSLENGILTFNETNDGSFLGKSEYKKIAQ